MRKEGSASYVIADSDCEEGRKENVWQNTPAHRSIHFDIRQDGRMGPAVLISVVRRSRSHLKKKLRYESVQLREYRGILQNPPARQMVSVIHQFILFFSIWHVEISRVIPARAVCLARRFSKIEWRQPVCAERSCQRTTRELLTRSYDVGNPTIEFFSSLYRQ